MSLSRSMLLGAVCVAAVSLPYSGARAQSSADLEAKVEALEAALEQLKEELAEQRADTVEQLDRLEAREPSDLAARPVAPEEGFMMGGTLVQLGGFIDFDFNVTDTSDGEIAGGSIARDFYIPSATPIGGVGESTPDADFTAEATRLFMTTQTERSGHDISSRLELDFLGSGQGNELVSNSFSPRLRHAFVQIDNWLVGQTWSTFQNTSTIPESASFVVLTDGMVFVRQPQIRYTRGPWAFAVENPNTRELTGGARDDGFAPDIVGKYTTRGEWGNASIAVLGRALVDERPSVLGEGADEETAFGWGLSVAGDYNWSPATGVKFSLTGGEGGGRYIGLAAVADARFDAEGSLDPIASVGGLAALHHSFSDRTRTTFGWSGLFADAELGETASVQSAYAVLAHDIAPRTTVAAEILHGRRTIEAAPGAADDGSITRFTASARYAF